MSHLQLGSFMVAVVAPKSLPDNVILLAQEHGTKIVKVTQYDSSRPLADGAILTVPHITLGIRTADCVPLVIVSSTTAIALHVSRKNLLADLLDAVPTLLPLKDITHVFIGPHICSHHFTFDYQGPAVKEFQKKFPAAVTLDTTMHISLRQAIQEYLQQWRIPAQAIISDNRCTYEDPSLYSYRRWLKLQSSDPLPTNIILIHRWQELN